MDNFITGMAVISIFCFVLFFCFIVSLIGWALFCSVTGADQKNSGFPLWVEMLIGFISGILFFGSIIALIYALGVLVSFFLI